MNTKTKKKVMEKKSTGDLTLLTALGDTARFNKPNTMVARHPDDPQVELTLGDVSKPISFNFVGMESDLFQESIYEGRRIKQQRIMEQEPYDPAWADEDELRNISYCVTGFENVPKAWFDGSTDMTPVPFPKDKEEARNLVYVLVKRLGWLRLQLQVRMWTREPFAKAS